jgi:hypothetical protein
MYTVTSSLDSIFDILPIYRYWWEIQTYWVNTFSPDGNGLM